MPIVIPGLDDLDFERLFEEARALIPRYAPDWTDHNFHDPGITMGVDLPCWLVDQAIWTAGFVSDRHLAAFAALLGVHPETAKPATGLIWPSEEIAIGGLLPEGTEATAEEMPELPFCLSHEILLTQARVEKTPVLDGTTLSITFDRPLVTQTRDNEPGTIALGIEILNEQAPASDQGSLIAAYSEDTRGEVWRAVAVRDTTRLLHRTGVILLAIPPTAGQGRRHLRLDFPGRVNPQAPRLGQVKLNVLPVEQTLLREEAVLNEGKGLPDETFAIESEPQEVPFIVEPGSLIVRAGGEGPWKITKDLTKAEPEQRVFELRVDEGEIVFGNGLNGAIPEKGEQIIRGPYRRTCGAAGNVAAKLRWRIATQARYGKNPRPFYGGEDPTTIEDLRREARQEARRLEVLLTDADLEQAVRELPGYNVARAEVRPGHDPAYPGVRLPGVRTVVVMPDRMPRPEPTEAISERFIQAVARHLEPRRVLGERLEVITPRLVPIRVQAKLTITDGVDTGEIKQEAIRVIEARLSALPVEGAKVDPWPAGRKVTKEEIAGLLAGIAGVARVEECRVARDAEGEFEDSIALLDDEIAIGREQPHRIEVEA